ncbi:hypothetical protein [Paenibacillus sp. JJ-100]|uniref:hypothetical protein n=1 Tax=Paenibacillus sp. JJ-100 TaxID=2974896 RepID=UPI00232C2BAA|nr:hypothetical protein [Paenibacillus sp. JJ-100]
MVNGQIFMDGIRTLLKAANAPMTDLDLQQYWLIEMYHSLPFSIHVNPMTL